MVNNLQMELEGAGVRASIVHPCPTKTSMGWSLPAEKIGPAPEDWRSRGQLRHDYFLRRDRCARRSPSSRRHPRGGYIAETWSYSPKPRWPPHRRSIEKLVLNEENLNIMTTAICPGFPAAKRSADAWGRLPHRSDRTHATRPRRVRRRRLVPTGRRARRCAVRRRGEQILLPLTETDLDQAEAYHHDADLGQGVVFNATRTPPGDAARLGAARSTR